MNIYVIVSWSEGKVNVTFRKSSAEAKVAEWIKDEEMAGRLLPKVTIHEFKI